MPLEFDHFFIAVTAPALEAELLTSLGLIEGTPNQHQGQGTANRRFFFHNAFIELLYLTDAQEAQSEVVKPTHLFERLSQQDQSISPFGVCFRPKNLNETAIPFPCWGYKPNYLPPHLTIPMADNNPLIEPLWFILPFGSAPINASTDKRQPLNHALGLKQLTSVCISQPSKLHSIAAQQVNKLAEFKIQQGLEHLMELSFDKAQAGLSHDFRPALPLIIYW